LSTRGGDVPHRYASLGSGLFIVHVIAAASPELDEGAPWGATLGVATTTSAFCARCSNASSSKTRPRKVGGLVTP
jgi:hypothetical protein